jgi:hypothetical protein
MWEGTGLGLATVYGIVKQHGSWISGERDRHGTALTCFFPATGEPVVGLQQKRTVSEVPEEGNNWWLKTNRCCAIGRVTAGLWLWCSSGDRLRRCGLVVYHDGEVDLVDRHDSAVACLEWIWLNDFVTHTQLKDHLCQRVRMGRADTGFCSRGHIPQTPHPRLFAKAVRECLDT